MLSRTVDAVTYLQAAAASSFVMVPAYSKIAVIALAIIKTTLKSVKHAVKLFLSLLHLVLIVNVTLATNEKTLQMKRTMMNATYVTAQISAAHVSDAG